MNHLPSCTDHETHPDRMNAAACAMPDEDSLFALADLYKIFGDSTRLRILYVLYETELCVCDIAELCGMTVSAISHQLRILKQSTPSLHREWSTFPRNDFRINKNANKKEKTTMKKNFKLEGLDCANCAAKIEKNVKKLDGVKDATVSFFAQKLVLEADDEKFDEIVKEVAALVHRVDPDCTMVL